MKSIFLLLFLALVGMTMQCMAQIDYKVSIPNIQSFVKINTNAVNIREAPNVNSKKIRTVSKEGLEVTSTLAVIGESGDWYKVYYYDRYDRYEYDTAIGYMMKKFCVDIPLEPVTEEMLQNISGGIISMCHQGKFKGLCFDWGNYTTDGMIEGPLYLGKVVDGMWVFDKMLPTVLGNSFQVKGSKDNHEYGINWQIVYNKLLSTYNGDDMTYFDSKKLKESNISYLLQNTDKMAKFHSHIFYCFKGDKYENEGKTYWNWKCIFYNPQDFGNDIVEK